MTAETTKLLLNYGFKYTRLLLIRLCVGAVLVKKLRNGVKISVSTNKREEIEIRIMRPDDQPEDCTTFTLKIGSTPEDRVMWYTVYGICQAASNLGEDEEFIIG